MFLLSLREVVFSETSAALSEGLGKAEVSSWLLSVQSFLFLLSVLGCKVSSEDSFEGIRIVNEVRHLDLKLRSFDFWALLLLFLFILITVLIPVAIEVVKLFVDVGLGEVISVDNLLNAPVLEEIKLLGTADATAERKDSTLFGVSAGGRMSDSKRAVDAMAILKNNRAVVVHVLLMAIITEVVCSEAAEEGNGAAEHALPVDLSIAMLVAHGCSSTHLFQEAILAEEVFLCGLAIVSVGHLLFAVNKTTEVGLFALEALVDGAAMVGELLWPSIVVVTNCGKSFITKDALCLSHLKSELLNTLFEADKRAQFASDGSGETFKRDLLLAARARHEGEGDSEGGPPVLEELDDTVGVEDMTARELGACFTTEFGCVANGAQFILISSLEVANALSTLGVEARKAVALLGDTFACMAALVSLVAEGKGRCLFLLNKSSWLASVDKDAFIFLDSDSNFGKLNCSRSVRVALLKSRNAGFKHGLFLVFIELMRNLSRHLDLFKHHHFWVLFLLLKLSCLFIFFKLLLNHMLIKAYFLNYEVHINTLQKHFHHFRQFN